MSQYIEISSNNYCVEELRCLCTKCKNMFSEYVPSNYELVCFLLENGEKRFLPTYGRYGYLDLMDRLIDKWEHNDKITEKNRKRFIVELQKITPYKVMANKIKCPLCGSYHIQIMRRNLQSNTAVKWLEIDMDFFDQCH